MLHYILDFERKEIFRPGFEDFESAMRAAESYDCRRKQGQKARFLALEGPITALRSRFGFATRDVPGLTKKWA